MDTEKKAVPQDPLAEQVIDKALLCGWADELNERMGFVHDLDATGEQAQALSLVDGVRPEDTLLSSGIIEARYGDKEWCCVPVLFQDASALAKRYTAEMGSATVNALLAVGKPRQQAGTHWTYTETYAVLKRRLNGGLLSIPDWAVIHAVDLIRRHNLNATNAALLTLLLDPARAGSPNGPAWVLIGSDQRLLRAAAAEGVHVLNPEDATPADAVAFLASL